MMMMMMTQSSLEIFVTISTILAQRRLKLKAIAVTCNGVLTALSNYTARHYIHTIHTVQICALAAKLDKRTYQISFQIFKI